MSRRSYITSLTPLPAHVSRETAVALLHDHEEMIRMNPLVKRMEATTPPANATPEEVKVMTWYAITDEIVYVPGTKVKGETTYKAGFYNLPRGLQTHVFAPAGVDMKTKWSVGGTLPGEEKESVELGLNAPREGLYIREDADLRCPAIFTRFVKKNLKKGHHVLCSRLVEKASLADHGRGLPVHRGSILSPDADSILRRWDHLYDASGRSQTSPGGSLSTASQHRMPDDTSCACQGVAHEPDCENYMTCGGTLSSSDTDPRQGSDVLRTSVAEHVVDQRVEDEVLAPTNVNFSPAGLHPCSCEGSVHTQGCAQYSDFVAHTARPRSMIVSMPTDLTDGQQEPFQLSLPAAADQEPLSAFPRSNPYSFSKPQSPAANFLNDYPGHTYRPQRPGEQAELPAALDDDADDDPYSAVELKPKPLLVRTQHGHAVLMELDGTPDSATRYWTQRAGEDETMPKG